MIKIPTGRPNTTTDVDITPDRSIIPKLGKGGYTLAQAIGELVDNAIEARVPNLQLHISIELSDRQIEVRDNARGMDREELAAAMRLAYRSAERGPGLGEFGIGMKAACMALGEKFTITSKPLDDETTYQSVFDENLWIKNGDWQRFPIFEVTNGLPTHGTLIAIERPRLSSIRVRAIGLREEFGVRYSPLFQEEGAIVKVNGVLCQPFRWRLHRDKRHDFELKLSSGNRITGWWGLLEEGSLGKYGFNLYNRGRLIRRYEKFGFTPHPDLAHLVGEIHLDSVPVTFSKREFIETSSEYEEAAELLTAYLEPAVKEARAYKLGQPAELPQRFLDQIHSNLSALSSLEEWPTLGVSFRILKVRSRPDGSFVADIQSNDRVITVSQRFIKGREDEPLLHSVVTEEGGLSVDLNSGHPVFSISKNRALLVAWAMIEALLLAALSPEKQRFIRSFLEDRDTLLGEMVRATR